jgi:hypothetical protein
MVRPKYANRHLELAELHLGQWVVFRGVQYKVAAASCLLDDPVVHLVKPDLDWDSVIELRDADLTHIFPAKVHPKE